MILSYYVASSYLLNSNVPLTWAIIQYTTVDNTVSNINNIEKDDILLKQSNDLIIDKPNNITPNANLIYHDSALAPEKLNIAIRK